MGTYANIAVNSPLSRGTTGFHYRIPTGLHVLPGQLVVVPFGTRKVQGVVLDLLPTSDVEGVKDILDIIDAQPALSEAQIELAKWACTYYRCSLLDAVLLMLPPGASQRSFSTVEISANTDNLGNLSQKQLALVNAVREESKIRIDKLKAKARVTGLNRTLNQLVQRGILVRKWELEKPRVKPKVERYVVLAEKASDPALLRETLKSSPKQAAVVEYLRKRESQRTLLPNGRYPSLASPGTPRSHVDTEEDGDKDKRPLSPEWDGTSAADDGITEARQQRGQRIVVASDDSPSGTEGGRGSEVAADPVPLREPIGGCPTADGGDAQFSQGERESRVESSPLPVGEGELGPLPPAEAGVPGVSLSQLYRDTGCTVQTVQALERKGLVRFKEQEVWRDPLASHRVAQVAPPTLTEEQARVWQELKRRLSAPEPAVFLIHGVTGSGKTELYMAALEETLLAGKRAIVMVPEIALTPQTVHRFSSRFPGTIAVLHSRLTLGEQYDEWRRIRDGEFRIVIGSRSAIFAPVNDLGLIVVDEEHEWSYKQEMTPRYNARDVAVRLGKLVGAKVILGSATPDIVTFHKAERGEYTLLSLPERVAPFRVPEETQASQTTTEAISSFMPPIHVVDLRQELRSGNRGIFSRALNEAIGLALSLKEQVILYLNRRGDSTFVMCRDCGFVLRCKRCDAPLVYHSSEDDLVCHLCARRSVPPEGCPNCWSSRIKFFGIGTQKVEEETKRLFPNARVVRWDRDTTREKGAHDKILQRFVSREADVLIGTQMIAKGLDLPKVTLVGVISADTGLHLPDYRAAERTFQLLTQVAGRAGRGTLGGRVIIQTYTPEHYCIRAASRHDYRAFYQQEIEFRRENGYPPFGSLIKLVYSHSNESRCQQEAERLGTVLGRQIDLQGLPATDIIGPAPAYARRIRGRYRWQLLIRGARCADVLQNVTLPVGWSVDVDPYSTL